MITSATSQTAIATDDKTVKSSSGRVFWVAATSAGNNITLALQDDNGTRDNNSLSPNQVMFQRFDPPLEFEGSIKVNVFLGSGLTLTMGYE